ncbi:DinB family protein [Algoriphagus namhaensis]|uniref:DinB family protein n=1 Tax=Algoriphagus namhaensis TaxID=915353 RepID=A0ABV8ALY5_9BACT
MKKLIATLCLISLFNFAFGQSATDNLPYSQIPAAAATYNSGDMVARMIDGLGYRFFWATEGLTQSDLEFTPSSESRNTLQTLEHIYSLSQTIRNTTLNQPNLRPEDLSGMDFEDFRNGTLENLLEASQALSAKDEADVAKLKMVFEGSDFRRELPIWNLINGPIADAIYHTGQVVMLRRMSGNPMNPKVNVLTGVTAK